MTSTAETQLSRFARARTRDGHAMVFHELHPQPFEIPADQWATLQIDPSSPPESLRAKLREHGLIADAHTDDAVLADARTRLHARLDATTLLYLVLVQDCNFGCSYCPIPQMAAQQGHRRMAPKTVRAAIDTWLHHLDDVPTGEDLAVIFYGGEPLLNVPAIKAGLGYLDYLCQTGRIDQDRLHLMLSTNGTLLTEDLAAMFARHGVAIAIGCDGPADAHDAVRRTTDGAATFEQVEAAIRLSVAQGLTTYVSTSVTPANVDAISGFTEFFRSLGVAKFGFNLLRGKLLFNLVPIDGLDDYHKRATDGIVANMLGGGDPRFEYQVGHRLDAFTHGEFFPVDCNAYGNQLVIDPNGNIGNCPFTPGDLGNVHTSPEDFRIAATQPARSLREELPLFNPECAPCDAKAICGGGCRWNVRELVDGRSTIDPGPCQLTKRLFEEAIWNPALTTAGAP